MTKLFCEQYFGFLDQNEMSQLPMGFNLEEFKTILREEIESNGGLILNYEMSALGQIPGRGHFGLAVALATANINDRKQTFLLLLDPWPETPIAWVPTDLMFNAINTTDKATGKHRGFLIRTGHLRDNN